MPSSSSLNDHGGTTSYPPTRAGSPHALSLGIAYDVHSASQTASNEWNEDRTPWNDHLYPSTPGQRRDNSSPKNDYGTGMQKGIGYSGLSSGATLLRTLQRFMPAGSAPTISQPYPEPGITSAPSNLTLNSERAQPPLLPPSSETGPLVDSYFRYFR